MVAFLVLFVFVCYLEVFDFVNFVGFVYASFLFVFVVVLVDLAVKVNDVEYDNVVVLLPVDAPFCCGCWCYYIFHSCGCCHCCP